MTELIRSNSANPSPDRPIVRRFFLDHLLSCLNRGNPAHRDMLRRHRLLHDSATQPYSTVPLSAYISFFEDCARLLDRPFLGCEMGASFKLWDLGPVYTLLATAPTLRNALDVFARFQAAWQSHTTLGVQSEYGEVRYSYFIEDQRIWPRLQDAEFAIAGLCGLVRQLGSDRWAPVEVTFEHDISAREAELTRYFRCRVKGNSASNGIVLRDSDLDRQLNFWLRANDPARRIVEEHLMDLLRQPVEDIAQLPERVIHAISQRLGQRQVDIESVAGDLGLSPRTLRRHLKSHGKTFTDLLTAERMKKAHNLLSGGSIKMDELAQRLGYSSQAVFSRAYREWTGSVPREARQKARILASHG